MGATCGKKVKKVDIVSTESRSRSYSGSRSYKTSKKTSRKTSRTSKKRVTGVPPSKVKIPSAAAVRLGFDPIYKQINQQQKQKYGIIKIKVPQVEKSAVKSPATNNSAITIEKYYINRKDLDKSQAVILLPKPAKELMFGTNKSSRKYYIDKKDLDQNQAVILVPKPKPTSKAQKGQKSKSPATAGQMGLDNFGGNVGGPMQFVEWEQKVNSPMGQEYQYYCEKEMQHDGLVQYQNNQVVKFDGPQTDHIITTPQVQQFKY